MKNNCCLPERLFQIRKNGVLRFGISFFVLEILMFSHYSVVAMETLGSSLFLSKTKYAHFQPFKVGKRVLVGTYMVPILS